MTRRLIIVALCAGLIVAVAGCGRKGPLQPPPASSMLPVQGDLASV